MTLDAELGYCPCCPFWPICLRKVPKPERNIREKHDAEIAGSACRAALAVAPFYWAALANLGTALHRQQRFAEAVATYTEAVHANPRNASAWTNLGVALHEQGRVADSLPMHDAAVAL
jgi:superkiller protein 3